MLSDSGPCAECAAKGIDALECPHGFPPLDRECEKCHGEGEVQASYYDRPRKVFCNDCAGLGRVPTPFGEAVLSFVTSRLRLRAIID